MKDFMYPLISVLLFVAGCGNGITNSSPGDGNASDLRQDGSGTPEFKDLSQGDAYTATLERPTLFVAGSAEEATPFLGWLNDSEAERRIQGVDFNTTWVIAVFRGVVGSAGYGIGIEDVEFVGKTVQLKVNLTDPDPEQMVDQVISYPYHIITAPKEFLPTSDGTTWAVYTSEGRMLTNTRYPIPTKPDDPIRADYLPLEAGKLWTYGDRDGAFRVTAVMRTPFGPAFVTEGLLQDRVMRKTEDGKILELRDQEWRLLFDFGAVEKASWTIEASEGGSDLLDGTTVTVVSRSEPVTVPYGTFESIHFRMRPHPRLADAGIADMWFAPGVGLVKWSALWIGGVRDFELTRLETVDPIMPDDSKGQPDTKLDIRGEITVRNVASERAREQGIIGSVLIEGAVEKDTGFDKASVKITERTRILKADGNIATFEALKTGQRVEARFIGPVAESYPVQATAAEIVILED